MIQKDKQPTLPMLFIAFMLTGLFFPASDVKAVSIMANSWGTNGEISYTVWTTITPDKSDYVAGESMIINMSQNVTTDVGADGVTLTDANTAYNRDAGGVRWNNPTMTGGPVIVDASPLNLPNSSSAGPFTGSSLPEVVPASLPLGSNYIRMRINYDTSVTSPIQRLGNMTFNVVAPVVNGSCSATHYNCTAGTSGSNAQNATQWTWQCVGSGGGSTANCSQAKPACAPNGSLYSWNGTNWDDFGSPTWSPAAFAPSYGMSNQGPLISAPTSLVGSVTGVTATAVGYPNRANILRCGAAPTVDLNF